MKYKKILIILSFKFAMVTISYVPSKKAAMVRMTNFRKCDEKVNKKMYQELQKKKVQWPKIV